MPDEFPPLPSLAASPRTDVLRLYRRICLLRASGQDAAADQVETSELPAALQSMQASGDETPVAPLFAAEEARVGEAALLAEMLAPLLANRLAVRPEGPRSSARTRGSGQIPGFPEPTGSSAAPSIADFIDGMLDQERAGSGPAEPIQSNFPAPTALRPQPITLRSR